ncbi:MAG: hypothetical protein ABL927_14155, partial [Bdellovibrionales bacterium]
LKFVQNLRSGRKWIKIVEEGYESVSWMYKNAKKYSSKKVKLRLLQVGSGKSSDLVDQIVSLFYF